MTNAEARFNNSLRPRKPEGSLGRTAEDGHLDSYTAPELWETAPELWEKNTRVIVPNMSTRHVRTLSPTSSEN